jgi:hypothetical protein
MALFVSQTALCARCWIKSLTLAVLATAPATSSLAQSPPVSKGEPVMVERPFATAETKKHTPRGISGIACLAPVGDSHSCLAVNDEERFAEWAVLKGKVLSPTGKRVQLLTQSDAQADPILGRMPQDLCKKTDDFGEFDGEAIAIVGNQLYVTGSHACSREKQKFKPSAFVLARARATGEAIAVDKVMRTWRVSDAIQNSPLKDAFGIPGPTGAGIEGMAAIGNRLHLGFRTPSAQGKATILSLDAERLFASGSEPSTAKPEALALDLGAGVGIRDLAALDEERILVLSGPADAGQAAYVLHVVTLSTGKLQSLAELRTDQKGKQKGKDGGPETAKAEGIAVIAPDDGSVTILVVYDNIDDGGPRLHRIRLPRN